MYKEIIWWRRGRVGEGGRIEKDGIGGEDHGGVCARIQKNSER